MDHPLAINQRFLKSTSPDSAALSWLRSLNVIYKTAHLRVNAFTSWLTHPQTFAFLLYLCFSCCKISNASSSPPLWNTRITAGSTAWPLRDLLYQPQKQQILHLWVFRILLVTGQWIYFLSHVTFSNWRVITLSGSVISIHIYFI